MKERADGRAKVDHAPQQLRAKFITKQLQLARKLWGNLSDVSVSSLRRLLESSRFSIAAGDLLLIETKWYVTHSGLLRLACSRHCSGILVKAMPEFCDPPSARWVFEATVYKSTTCKGFVGHGDADPSNVSPLVRGAEMRVAETRAVNRALRKAYGIGLCSVEEIGSAPPPAETVRREAKRPPTRANGSNGNGQPSLRDRLSQLIRQHQLDPALVKLYAADYCGTPELRQASREQVESFINHLAEQAVQDRDALLCQLTSYSKREAGAA
jgi:hypothetical protein